MMGKKRLVAVIGGSQASKQEIKTAEDVGRELAKRGAAVVCGGLGGVMEAACRGAISEGGITIGILPGENRHDANQYVQIPIVTGMGYSRNVAVVKSAQAVIAIGGSYGTLSEIGHAIQSGIPVIGIDTWSLVKGGKVNGSIIPAESAIDAVEKAFNLIVD
ncbi:MAG: TIGR00725 family protein [Dehalococcoidales bacterium]|nr:TIGR00725 family protein [Dehalococcoidales bacterium]